MDQEILKKIEEQGAKLDGIYRSVERTRKYFLYTLLITLAVIVLPLIGLVFVIPQFISTYGGGL